MKSELNIGLITLADWRYNEILDITSPNKSRYCQRHGYYNIEIRNSLDESRPTSWSKILAIYSYLGRFDWLFWNDPDSVIMNSAIKLEDIIDAVSIDDNVCSIFNEDDNGLNAGVFLIKRCKRSHDLLQTTYSKTEYIHHQWWEQAAIRSLDPLVYGIRTVPAQVMNSHPTWGSAKYKEGDFIIHYSGSGGNCDFVRQGLRECVAKAK